MSNHVHSNWITIMSYIYLFESEGSEPTLGHFHIYAFINVKSCSLASVIGCLIQCVFRFIYLKIIIY